VSIFFRLVSALPPSMAVEPKAVYTILALAVSVGAAAYLLYARAPAASTANYSYVVPDTEDTKKGLGAIHRCPKRPDRLVGSMADGAATSYEAFESGVRRHGANRCLGTRAIMGRDAKGAPIVGPYVWETYDEIHRRVANFAAGLVHLELLPELPGSKETGPLRLLALYLKNRTEWVIAEQACFRQGAATVPMYDTLGPDTVEMILNETELTTVLTTPGCLPALKECKARCPSLQNVIYVDELPPTEAAALAALGLKVFSFRDVENAGSANPVAAQPPSGDSVATFCYTSGTTGKSKGAVLTHRNLVSVTASVDVLGVNLGPTDRHLSYLPLAHVFERASMLLVLNSGAQVGFFQGETARLPDDLVALRPTFFPSVPRLLNRFHDKILAGVEHQGGLKAKLFWLAVAAKRRGHRSGRLQSGLWDRLVFRKIANRIGLDCCRFVITGSAPIAPHVLEFLRILLGCPVVEGYGQTETGAGSTVQFPSDLSLGNVGGPLACNEIRLVAVPEMGYLPSDRVHGADSAAGLLGIPCEGRGEICFRGPNCFLGYYKMPEITAEALDDEGWVHSGDIGLWTPKGQLKVIDRKKNIFKLAQGEYVAPEKVENVYTKSLIVAQAFVHGDSFQSQVVGIIVPDAEAAPKFCADNGIPVAPIADLCGSPEFKKAVQGELEKLRRQAKLFTFEHVADIHLEPTHFSIENDLLTPTFKLKRDVARKHYQKEIDALYGALAKTAKP